MRRSKPNQPYLRRGHPLNHGLAGGWPFCEGSGTTTRDVSGLGNHATLVSGPTRVTTEMGRALDLVAASSQYINVPYAPSLQPPLPVSIVSWIVADSFSPAFPVFNNDDTSNFYYGIKVRISTAGKLESLVGNGGAAAPAGRQTKSGTTVLSTGIVYCVAAVIRTPTDHSLYVNGLDDGGDYSGSGNSLAYNAGNTNLGRADYSSSLPEWHADGRIISVAFYSRLLSPAEIRALAGWRGDPWEQWRPMRRRAMVPAPIPGDRGRPRGVCRGVLRGAA